MKNLARRGRPLLGWLLLWVALSGPAWAETLTVTTTQDSGPGSLRQALLDATAGGANASTIVFAPTADGVITLASPLPPLRGGSGSVDLSITGNGPARTIIDGAGLHQPFRAEWQNNLHVALRRLTLRNGYVAPGQGAAIYMHGGTGSSLTLDTVEMSGHRGASSGGALYASVPTVIENSLFRDNRASSSGAAVEVWDTTLSIRNSTFTGNRADHSTITFGGNAQSRGRFVNVTVIGAGVRRSVSLRGSASLSLSNSLLVADAQSNGADLDRESGCTFEQATSFNNVIGDAGNSGFENGVNGNQLGVTDPLIGPPGAYGGDTWTVPLLPGSPALNAGTASGDDIPASDQRGLARVGSPDVGAFESRGFSLARAGGDGQSSGVNTAFADPLVVQAVANDSGERVEGGRVVFAAPSSGPGARLVPSLATLDANGRAQATATANDVAGGPYVVKAIVASGDGATIAADFSLTNTAADACDAFAFPYTLAGADNAARVAELREAIACANARPGDDAIDLGGHALAFGDAPYADADGADALPIVSSGLTLRNGTLSRDASAPAFRFLRVDANGRLIVQAMTLRNGAAGTDGGAILANGLLTLRRSVFEDNRAAAHGGAVAARGDATVLTSRFKGNAAADGAAIAGWGTTLVMNSRFERNGDGASASVIWSDAYFGMIGSLVAGHTLPAAGSSLMAFTDATTVAEMRNVTIAGNAVQGELLRRHAANVQLHNSIVWDNQYESLGRITPDHSLVPGVPAIDGNLDQPPGFVDAPGDYRLDAGSPAIDAGDNSYGFTDAFDVDEDGDTSEMLPDLDLHPRPLDDAGVADTGNGTAPILDMGAFERQTESGPAGITVTPTQELVTTEAGGTATFAVVLDRYPTADVTLTLASSNSAEGTVAPASLTFTQADWNRPRTVVVTGMDDGVADGDQVYAIVTGPASSADPAYDGIDPPDVAVVNEDDDAATHHVGGTVIGLVGSGLALSLTEANETLAIGANGRFAFAAALAPGAAYSVAVSTQPHDPAQACVVVNGTGTVGTSDVDDVIVNCGASATYAIGGTVAGLGGGSVTLQLNGGGDLIVSADGSYAFPARLIDGADYVVTVRAQPQGKLCTLAHATGVVQGADVTDVDVSCAPLQVNLHLAVDDGHAFARYGQVRDYFVTLANSGNSAADGIAIAATFSAAFDVANAHWQCLSGAGYCSDAGSGGFSDTANVPANGSVTWIVSAPVRGDSNESVATLGVGQSAGAVVADAADTDTLVIFRDGYDVPYGDGAEALVDAAPLPLRDDRGEPIEWPAAVEEGITLVRRCETPDGRVDVQRLKLGSADFVRLLGTDDAGRQRASAWAAVAPAARLVVTRVAGDAPVVLLEGAAHPLALPQAASHSHGDIK